MPRGPVSPPGFTEGTNPRVSEPGRLLSVALGNVIRRRRLARALEVRELAALAGLHKGTMCRIELSRIQVRTDDLVRIAVALETSPVDLIAEAVAEAFPGGWATVSLGQDEAPPSLPGDDLSALSMAMACPW